MLKLGALATSAVRLPEVLGATCLVDLTEALVEDLVSAAFGAV